MTVFVTIMMLFASNVFMNFAWYGHLKSPQFPIWKAILMSWGIAFFEYLIIVPANRLGNETLSIYQLKIIQEVITMIVFIAIAVYFFKEGLKWNYIVGFGFMMVAVFFVFFDWKR